MVNKVLASILSNPEVLEALKVIAPEAIEKGGEVVIRGIETTGDVLKCAIKDGEIIKHSAETAQQAIASTENVAISVIDNVGKVAELLIKDGKIVEQSAATVRFGIKTAGEISNRLLDNGKDVIIHTISELGDVSNNAITALVDLKNNKEREKTKRISLELESGTQIKIAQIVADGKKYASYMDAIKERPEIAIIFSQVEIEKKRIEAQKEVEKSRVKWDGIAKVLDVASGVATKLYELTPIGSQVKVVRDVIKILTPRKKKDIEETSDQVYKYACDLLVNMTEIPEGVYPSIKALKRILNNTIQDGNRQAIAGVVISINKELTQQVPELRNLMQ